MTDSETVAILCVQCGAAFVADYGDASEILNTCRPCLDAEVTAELFEDVAAIAELMRRFDVDTVADLVADIQRVAVRAGMS